MSDLLAILDPEDIVVSSDDQLVLSLFSEVAIFYIGCPISQL